MCVSTYAYVCLPVCGCLYFASSAQYVQFRKKNPSDNRPHHEIYSEPSSSEKDSM